MKPTTEALHRRAATEGAALPSVTPIYQNSAFESGSPYFYTRNNNPNVEEFESVVAALEGARHAVAVSTGMAAISAALQFLRPGDAVVVNKDVYGCSYKLFQRAASRMSLDLTFLDLSSSENIARMPDGARMVFFETPTNPFLKSVDIAAVAREARAKRPDALVVVDNTWATPLYQRPLELGADISLHSATKYFSGHSDVMGGVLLTNRPEVEEELRATRFYHGAILDPHSAWLLRRSMQTFAVRMERHNENAARVRDFLSTCPQVARVYYPEVDGRQLKGYGGLLFFELRADLVESYALLAGALELFQTGTGMACVTSMIAQPYTGSHASMTPEEKAEMGLGRELVRLSIGLEDFDDLREDLTRALAAIESSAARATVPVTPGGRCAL